ncbi:Sensor histidine kinase DesK [Pseudoclavibacter triregionum]|nr:Sensor histidine kinase DesK [Pseudoclavibacter triregionum]
MKNFGRAAAAATHLILYGAFGPVVLTVMVVLVSVGAGTVPLLGFGLVLLAVFALGVYGLAWIEERRVEGLFGIALPPHPMRRSTRTDWLRIPMTLLLQLADPRTWLAVLHGAIISVLGGVALVMAWSVGQGIGLLFTPLASHRVRIDSILGIGLPTPFQLEQPWPLVLGAVTIAASLGVLFGLTVAHRAISTHMLVPSREAELEAAVKTASERRTQAMRAAEVERTRIERDLHDGVQPRLVSIGMTLGMAKAKLDTDPEGARRLIDEAHASTKTAVTELRQLARGINPAVLQDRGLDAALSALVARSHIPVQLEVRRLGRYAPQTEAAMYFVVAEALTNAAKHSNATSCRVTLEERDGGRLWARVEDDGQGGAIRHPGGGLDGIANRVAAAGGTFSLSSPEGGPTTIEASLPCAS